LLIASDDDDDDDVSTLHFSFGFSVFVSFALMQDDPLIVARQRKAERSCRAHAGEAGCTNL
jgi:hypothetical protein